VNARGGLSNDGLVAGKPSENVMHLRLATPPRLRSRASARAADVDHALTLYQREQVSAGRAAELAGMSKPAFEALLMRRGIWLHYDEADLHADLATLAGLLPR
jgi:predicted HTH domain antitoxin